MYAAVTRTASDREGVPAAVRSLVEPCDRPTLSQLAEKKKGF